MEPNEIKATTAMISHPKNGVIVRIFNKIKTPNAENDNFQNLNLVLPGFFNQFAAATEIITVESNITTT